MGTSLVRGATETTGKTVCTGPRLGAKLWLVFVLTLGVAATWVGGGSSLASAATFQVSGAISEDATWTAGSTYQLTDHVDVRPGASLVIEPGTLVVGDGHMLAVSGALSAIGSESSPVVFRNVDLRGRGRYVYPSAPETFTIDIRYADIDGGALQGGGESMYGSWALRDSFVTNVDAPMYLWFPLADCYVERNVFIDTGKISAGVHAANVYVQRNLFYRSNPGGHAMDLSIEDWAVYNGFAVRANRNSFLNLRIPTVGLAPWSSSGALDASQNWWGVAPSETSTIAAMVFDQATNALCPGLIDTSGPLAAPAADVPSFGQAFASLPVVTSAVLSGPSGEVPAGTPIALSGQFAAVVRGVPRRGMARLLASVDGGAWAVIASRPTELNGSVVFVANPTRDTAYRIGLDGVEGVALAAESDPVTVLVSAQVGPPAVPRSARRSRAFSFAGVLTPRKSAGSQSVAVRFYRKEGRRWRLRATVLAVNTDYGDGSLYVGSVRLKLAGTYRVISTYSEAGRAMATSAISTMKVR
jgi:hypothetical protein